MEDRFDHELDAFCCFCFDVVAASLDGGFVEEVVKSVVDLYDAGYRE